MSIFKYENDQRLLKSENIDKGRNYIEDSDRDRNLVDWVSTAHLNVNQSSQFCQSKEANLNSNLVRIELERDSSIIQWNKIRLIIVSFAGVFFLSLIRGSFYYKSIIGVETYKYN